MEPATLYDRLTSAARVLAERTGVEKHDAVAVLGSGLGGYPDRFAPGEAVAVPYRDLPGFPIPKAMGHSGTAFSVQMGPNRILLFSGRAHAYEGHSAEAVTFPVRAAILPGAARWFSPTPPEDAGKASNRAIWQPSPTTSTWPGSARWPGTTMNGSAPASPT